METKTYKNRLLLLNRAVLSDIRDYVSVHGQLTLPVDEDAPAVNTVLRFYDGGRYPVKETVQELHSRDGKLVFRTAGGAKCYGEHQLYSQDIPVLNKGFETVVGCNTPAKFARLINRCENFPFALHVIMDVNGWYDLTDEEDTGNVCWCPREKTLVLFEGGRAVTRRTGGYSSPEMDWHHAEEWFRGADFKTLERISGLRQDDFSPEDGYQDFVDAVHRWWASLENDFPDNGKQEKVRIWKTND